ncbi:histidine kinase [Streptomyces sp. NPDC046203]|uniref:sensor histidine kinase n=1 Tax=Streptomyces sp. NPDC046203 TaxID=3154602 RepID=UPI00340E42D7
MRSRAAWAARLRQVDPRVVDTALALGLIAATAGAGRLYQPQGWPPFDAAAYALTVLVGAPLAFRRVAPMAALTASCLAFACYLTAGYVPSLNVWLPAVAFYSLAAQRPFRIASLGAGLVAAVTLYSGLSAPEIGLTTALIQAVALPAVVWELGNNARRIASRNRRLALLTAQLREAQEERARRAVIEEQHRIARELHDVVAHHMSVINIQAGMAGYVFESAPGTARTALDTISSTSQEGLNELRRMLTLLRSEAESEAAAWDAPMPGLAQLPDVAARVRSAGVPVALTTTGTPRPLAPGAELCAYRVVQEALTNVLKHARPARATVLVVYAPDHLSITITDDGHRDRDRDHVGHGGHRDPANVGARPGHGLIGMRERARLYGGNVDAGPRAEGGFAVRLRLPVAEGTSGR